MSRENKIHCEDKNSYAKPRTNCGRFCWYVISVHNSIFDKLKEKYKCIPCMKKENAEL